MNDLLNNIKNLATRLEKALSLLNLEDERDEMRRIETLMSKGDFWQDKENAQGLMKKFSDLKNHIEVWDDITKKINDLASLVSSTKENDSDLIKEFEKEYQSVCQDFESLEFELMFSGPFDDHNVVLSISAGSGGTDAQDWAEILRSMYLKYAAKTGFGTKILDEVCGDEAGIKSSTIEISGKYAYGYFKGEHGVHRLVRISPFDADKARHTSFALAEVVPEIDDGNLEINEKDLKIDTYRSSGHGGQSVNTTDSAVRITHLPTGVTATSQNERSQLQNRETALKILKSRLIDLEASEKTQKLQEIKGKPVSAEWGNQIRSYVLQPYTLVKDNRTGYETGDVQAVLDGNLADFTEHYLAKVKKVDLEAKQS